MRKYDCPHYVKCLDRVAYLEVEDMPCATCDGTVLGAAEIIYDAIALAEQQNVNRRKYDLDVLDVDQSMFFPTCGEPVAVLRQKLYSIMHKYKPRRFILRVSTEGPEGVICERIV